MTVVAAVQMQGKIADVAYNWAQVRQLLSDAIAQGAQVIALPEFFTTPIVQDKRLWRCALPPENAIVRTLGEFATRHHVLIGGSYLEKRGDDVYNCYVLAHPDGRVTRHDKDLPTMIENAYYTGGNDDGWHESAWGRVGTAVCWETIRTQTVRRLAGRVDFLMTGSHWWAPPSNWRVAAGFMHTMDQQNRHYMLRAPGEIAHILGVPNIHAAHCGPLHGTIPLTKRVSLPFDSYLLGETQIVDATGTIRARLKAEDGPGVISTDLDLRPAADRAPVPHRFWIPKLTARFRFFWWQQNMCGRALYRYAQKTERLHTTDIPTESVG